MAVCDGIGSGDEGFGPSHTEGVQRNRHHPASRQPGQPDVAVPRSGKNQRSTAGHRVSGTRRGAVFVLWDGKRLWTKSGNQIDAPASFLQFFPPAFALVGELFFGYGHKEFQYAKIVSQNKLPIVESHATNSRALVWQFARVVAFDTPMVMDLRYEQRTRCSLR